MSDPRVLALRRGALGDSICFLPVLAAIRASEPAARIEFAGDGDFAELLADRCVVDRGFSAELLGLQMGGSEQTRVKEQRLLDAYDWIVGDVNANHAHDLAARVTSFGVVVDEHSRLPASAQLLERARAVWPMAWPAVTATPRLPRRRPPTADLLWIHPGSGSPRKNWHGHARLARAALEQRLRVVVSFGEADDAIRARLEPELPAAVERVTDRRVSELANELEQATVFVGNDSGVTHLAAALDVPTIALFTASRPEVWAPPKAEALRFDTGESEVDVLARVLAAISRQRSYSSK